MFTIHKQELEWAGRTLTLETGQMARQADGSVVATYGETVVLATAVAEKQMKPGMDFFPLTVQYQEKTFAAGKIPGGFFKREGRLSEKETLVSRLIDRPLRPLFPKTFRNETQVICTVLSHDLENDPDMVAMVAASAALAISGMPFMGPIGGARVGFVNGKYVINPTPEELEASVLDLVVAGKSDGVMMVESQASELSEKQMLGAVMAGHEAYQPVIQAIQKLAKDVGNKPWEVAAEDPRLAALLKKMDTKFKKDLAKAYAESDKQERRSKIGAVKTAVKEAFVDEETEESLVSAAFSRLEYDLVRGTLMKTKKRIDGRDTKTVRPIECAVHLLPRAHGSALFTRGETQALAVTTLGTGQDEQIMDELQGERRENFMLHYNFPPFSVGEARRLGPPGRREIGHGKLAWRAMRPLLPTKEEFPYTIRIVSEVLESNGSSSMATVCGASLSLMDAGVPLKRPVAGIAMGLIKDAKDFLILSDILGDEDHLGDMDFKVAGTDQGVTALQMDIKVTGITEEIMEEALAQAQEGRFHILGEMSKAMSSARDDLSDTAPRIESISVPKDKIGEIIGPGGSNIRDICETTQTKIDIDDDGKVSIAAPDASAIEAAMNRIRGIIAEPEIGVVYSGKVVRIMDFGAFVNFLGKQDGLVHISELESRRVERVTDVVNEGDKVYVQVLAIERGKVRLSMKSVDQKTGNPIEIAD